MTGRPRTKKITVRFDSERGRWVANVPPEVGGRRVRKFFEGESGALAWAAERQSEFAGGESFNALARDPNAGGLSVSSAVAIYLADRAGEVSAGQLKLVKNHLSKFSRKFGGLPIEEPEPLVVRKWLRDLEYSQRTRFGIFSSCRTFYRWLLLYSKAKTSPFDRMAAIPRGEAPKAILTPEEMTALLAMTMPDYVRAWLVLSGFVGLRTEEIFRSDWTAANFESKEFHVSPTAIKRDRLRMRGIRERFAEMPAAALRLCPRGLSGPIVPVSKTTFFDQASRLSVALAKMRGVELGKKKRWNHGRLSLVDAAEWPHDCLRHSAATYLLSIEQDARKVAFWLGHTSEKMVHDNYSRATPRAVAEAWWRIGLNPGA